MVRSGKAAKQFVPEFKVNPISEFLNHPKL